MLPEPLWLQLFRGGIGEMHPAEVWQATADQQRAAIDHMHADHEQDPLSAAPVHRNPRWARAVACVVLPQPTGHRDVPGGTGTVLWSDGFAEPPRVGTEPTAPRPPGLERGQGPTEGDWWLNWRLAEDRLWTYPQVIQTVTLGFQLRPGVPPPPPETAVLVTYTPMSPLEGTEHTRTFWSGAEGEGSLRLGMTGYFVTDPRYDDDWEVDPFLRHVERVYLAVR